MRLLLNPEASLACRKSVTSLKSKRNPVQFFTFNMTMQCAKFHAAEQLGLSVKPRRRARLCLELVADQLAKDVVSIMNALDYYQRIRKVCLINHQGTRRGVTRKPKAPERLGSSAGFVLDGTHWIHRVMGKALHHAGDVVANS